MEKRLNNFDADSFANVFGNNAVLQNDTMKEETSETKKTPYNKGKSTVVHS